MKIQGKTYQTIWWDEKDQDQFFVIDQRRLPHFFDIEPIKTAAQSAKAIREMHVRGAPLIGATAAYGMVLACLEAQGESSPKRYLENAKSDILNTRPTAVNLAYAVQRVFGQLDMQAPHLWASIALLEAHKIREESIEECRNIGLHGLPLIEALHKSNPNKPVNILTHCNAGWMACVDYGTATAPIYLAHDQGIPVHVWVDETRPRNQGARITAFELLEHGIPHTVIPDNTGGHLMQHGLVDMVIVGTDRTTRTGDVANKIGTYLKALAAFDNEVPFYVATPSSSIDWQLEDGLKEIPIEQRHPEEVSHIQGLADSGLTTVQICPMDSPVINYGFDVTPSRLVTGLVTERGICRASEEGIATLFQDKLW